jgi:hypothetical protein
MEYYTKLFNLTWVEPWLIEALIAIFGALILTVVVCKAIDCFNGESS